jgi:hypothetical protein
VFSADSSARAPQQAMRRLASILALAAMLAGCGLVSPEAKVRGKLLAAGVKPHMANCLAPKLVKKLSTAQLEALGKAVKQPREDGHHLSIGDLADRLDAIGDPQIVDVVTRAGLACAILG